MQEIISEQKKPLRFILSRLLWNLGVSHRFIIYREGYSLRFFPTSLSASYWIDPRSRSADETFLKRYLKAGDFVVDVGANVGTIAIAAATLVGERGGVIAIEPHPRTFGYLEANAHLNELRNLAFLNVAVGNKRGTISFSDMRMDDQNCVVESSPLVVPLETLDSLMSNLQRRVALLKIDVEGYELPVLQGAETILERTDCVYFESWEDLYAKYGYTCVDVNRYLKLRGFSVYKRGKESVLQEVSSHYSSLVCENLIALSAEGKRRSIEERVFSA
jgi:FkbM family methyltransferase